MKIYLNKILRWSEEYTKTDMVYIFKHSMWLNMGQFVNLLTIFFLSVVLSHALPKEVYGNYKFILSIAGIISGLSLSGLSTSITQAVAKGHDGTLNLSVRTQLMWGNILGFLSLIVSYYYFLNDNFVFAISFIIVATTIPITNALSLYGAFLNGKKDFKRNTIYWIFTQLVNSATIIIIAITTNNIIYLVLGYFLSTLIFTIIFYRKTMKIYKPDIKTGDRSMIRYGQHLSVMGFIGTIANQLDKILVFQFVGAGPLAVYSFANAIPEQLRSFLKNIINVGIPKFAELDEKSLRKSIIDKIFRLTAIMIFIVFLYYISAPYIYKIFFPKYLESIVYSRIYILGLVTLPGISLISIYFQMIKNTKVLYIFSTIGSIATIILSLLIIPIYGVYGAVIENTLSWTIMLLVGILFFVRDGKKI